MNEELDWVLKHDHIKFYKKEIQSCFKLLKVITKINIIYETNNKIVVLIYISSSTYT